MRNHQHKYHPPSLVLLPWIQLMLVQYHPLITLKHSWLYWCKGGKKQHNSEKEWNHNYDATTTDNETSATANDANCSCDQCNPRLLLLQPQVYFRIPRSSRRQTEDPLCSNDFQTYGHILFKSLAFHFISAQIGTAFSGSDNLSSIWREKYAYYQSSLNLKIIEPSSSVEAEILLPVKVTRLNRTLGFSTKVSVSRV